MVIEIRIEEKHTGEFETTYVATLPIRIVAKVDFMTNEGYDLRIVEPSTAALMQTDAKRRLNERLMDEMVQTVMKRFEEEAKDGIVVTRFVKDRLLVVSPEELPKALMEVKKRAFRTRIGEKAVG